MKLFGYFAIKVEEKVEFLVSPSRLTTFSLQSLAFFKPFPYAFLVEILEFYSYSGVIEMDLDYKLGDSPLGENVVKYVCWVDINDFKCFIA
jgi:hypothetical protein